MSTALSDNDKWLAAEFAMGVLEGEDLAVAEKRFEEDVQFRKSVEDWQNQLTPILNEVEPAEPAPRVWDQIAARTQGADEAMQSSWWTSLAFWRGSAAFAGSLAALSIAALLFLSPGGLFVAPELQRPLIATLTAAGTAPAFTARFDPGTGALFVRTALKDQSEQRVAELWLIPADGVPRSLGLLDNEGLGDLSVTGENLAVFRDGATLAVSLEPQGGSPTGAPTGPVIASGKLAPI